MTWRHFDSIPGRKRGAINIYQLEVISKRKSFFFFGLKRILAKALKEGLN
jgi:hypothetical protein